MLSAAGAFRNWLKARWAGLITVQLLFTTIIVIAQSHTAGKTRAT